MRETDDHKPRGGSTHAGIGISQIATGPIYNTLGRDEQVAFNSHLKVLADRFRYRVLRIPLITGGDLT